MQCGFIGRSEHDIESPWVAFTGIQRCRSKLLQHEHKEFHARLKVGQSVAGSTAQDFDFFRLIPWIWGGVGGGLYVVDVGRRAGGFVGLFFHFWVF